MVQKISHQWNIYQQYGQQAGMTTLVMSEASFFEKISAYIAENKRNTALKAELSHMTISTVQREAETRDSGIHPTQSLEDPFQAKEISGEDISQILVAIYDEEPLGFEKDPMGANIKMLAQDPLEKVNLGDGD